MPQQAVVDVAEQRSLSSQFKRQRREK